MRHFTGKDKTKWSGEKKASEPELSIHEPGTILSKRALEKRNFRNPKQAITVRNQTLVQAL
jgi:hypothetical protein